LLLSGAAPAPAGGLLRSRACLQLISSLVNRLDPGIAGHACLSLTRPSLFESLCQDMLAAFSIHWLMPAAKVSSQKVQSRAHRLGHAVMDFPVADETYEWDKAPPVVVCQDLTKNQHRRDPCGSRVQLLSGRHSSARRCAAGPSRPPPVDRSSRRAGPLLSPESARGGFSDETLRFYRAPPGKTKQKFAQLTNERRGAWAPSFSPLPSVSFKCRFRLHSNSSVTSS
jgi:hypothetical protein